MDNLYYQYSNDAEAAAVTTVVVDVDYKFEWLNKLQIFCIKVWRIIIKLLKVNNQVTEQWKDQVI